MLDDCCFCKIDQIGAFHPAKEEWSPTTNPQSPRWKTCSRPLSGGGLCTPKKPPPQTDPSCLNEIIFSDPPLSSNTPAGPPCLQHLATSRKELFVASNCKGGGTSLPLTWQSSWWYCSSRSQETAWRPLLSIVGTFWILPHMCWLNHSCVLRQFLGKINHCWRFSIFSIQSTTVSQCAAKVIFIQP